MVMTTLYARQQKRHRCIEQSFGRCGARGFSRVAAGFSSYDGDFRLPLGLALGSPNFLSSCEGKLGVVLESLQDQRDLI